MYHRLYEYLLLYGDLSLPGVGTLHLQRKPAAGDFPNRLMQAPVYSLSFTGDEETQPSGFVSRLAGIMRVSDKEAGQLFREHCTVMGQALASGAAINWDKVGILKKGLAGEIKFVPANPVMQQRAVPADKIIREKAAHWVKVGESDKTSEEMTALLHQVEKKRSYWWVPALIAGSMALGFIIWHLNEHGWQPGASANNIPLQVAPANDTP